MTRSLAAKLAPAPIRGLQRDMTEAHATARVLAIYARRIRDQAASGDTVGLHADLTEMAREARGIVDLVDRCVSSTAQIREEIR